MPEQTQFTLIVADLKAWYLSRYGIKLTNYKLAQQVQQRTNRNTYFRTISAIESGHMPAWDVGAALQDIRAEWIPCKSTLAVDERLVAEA